jgi:thiamine pyrophosphate-dependent acetolactate synthase large subunit-like protein
MKRAVAAKLIKELLGPTDIVMTSLGSTGRAWREAGAANPTYSNSDPMGLSCALALGMALARPDRRVMHLTGDGDLLMNIGVLVTIAGARPRNLYTVVFHNGRYETGGGQPLASQDLDLATMARGAGIAWAERADFEEEAGRLLSELLSGEGPRLLVLGVEPESSPYAPEGPWTQTERRAFFLKHLNES